MALSWRGSSCHIHSQSQGTATVQQLPVEDSRAITKLEVTSPSPKVTKEFSTIGPIKGYATLATIAVNDLHLVLVISF